MKNLRTTLLCVCMLCTVYSFAQNEARVNEPDLNKPKLFTGLPDKIPVNPASYFNLLAEKNAGDVNFILGDATPFEGRIVSTAGNADSESSSIVVRSTNFPGATLTLTRVVVDGKASYIGRIISMKHADIYELQFKDEKYHFVKRNYYDLINE